MSNASNRREVTDEVAMLRANACMGRIRLINSGGASGEHLRMPSTPPWSNRRGACCRKVFQRPMPEGTKLLQLIQDVYACDEITADRRISTGNAPDMGEAVSMKGDNRCPS